MLLLVLPVVLKMGQKHLGQNILCQMKVGKQTILNCTQKKTPKQTHKIIIKDHPMNPQNILAISPVLASLCLCKCQISATQNLKSILPLAY